MDTGRRTFLGTLGVGLLGTRFARAQTAGRGAPPVPVRKVKTTTLFKSPEGYPNAITATGDGLWIGEQKTENAQKHDERGDGPMKSDCAGIIALSRRGFVPHSVMPFLLMRSGGPRWAKTSLTIDE